ncbi:hypothetical protein L861_08720 [Litchfieldella anticariensis FP35 = DSM 16096]|uniref:YqjK-like protein n=1 Tax=Litchfieldella anticariensis (strain DSM 16096 / CECT 5854 / CIP 108499 / LMG 22089 / FP35) TaxID=1121939 RepID=S2LCI7_LITA3|nr:YqjK family protein [Halomonas anticariensis]EPC02446.1 hypothetical protein L861_08720 [Halomonas anticariensis FP35 = DSM 16096]
MSHDRPPHLSSSQQRALSKAELETRIEQQRIDILVESNRWREASGGIDAAWHTLMRFKVPLLAVGSIVLLRGTRNPRAVLRVGRRVATWALLARRAQRLLGKR